MPPSRDLKAVEVRDSPPWRPPVAFLLSRRLSLETALTKLQHEIDEAVLLIVQEAEPGLESGRGAPFKPGDLVPSDHICTGAVGRCVYDHVMDHGHDCCIFCGQPQER